MTGNVWEWTSDWYVPRHPDEVAEPVLRPGEPARDLARRELNPGQPGEHIPRRVIKGGSHLCAPNYCLRYRPAARQPQMIDTSMAHLGFRCVVRDAHPCLGRSDCLMADKPNILVIWGDDIGITNLSCYSDGLMGYRTPEHRPDRRRGDALHRLLRRAELHRGPLVVHHRPERLPHGPEQGRRCPGADDRAAAPRTRRSPSCSSRSAMRPAQFGKNHLGDRNEFLPTVHGFDEFFGNLYHLNAEEEPELPNYPPAEDFPSFHERFGPRGVLHCWATDEDDPTPSIRAGGASASRRSRTRGR